MDWYMVVEQAFNGVEGQAGSSRQHCSEHDDVSQPHIAKFIRPFSRGNRQDLDICPAAFTRNERGVVGEQAPAQQPARTARMTDCLEQ